MTTRRTAKKRLTRPEQRAATRVALLEAAWAVFLRRGYAGSSVEQIAAEAGYTRGAFYYNFGSLGEIFVELLEQRVYSLYREMAESRLADSEGFVGMREAGEELAKMQAREQNRRLFRLGLELLAEAGRDEKLRALAAQFWRGNRGLLSELIEREREHGAPPLPVPEKSMATAAIALDIGLALQHYIDPQEAPLDLYPDLFEALFGRFVAPQKRH